MESRLFIEGDQNTENIDLNYSHFVERDLISRVSLNL